ncbi:MAG: asparaginase domain-containing protein [Firmicutes bacterium]|nr:asparaginase domain-containing protein [Bacillota bacterium]
MNNQRNYNLYASFFALYQTGTMSDAAEMLKYDSHTSVSKNIKALETELGVKLFTPHSRGVAPTMEATRLYERIHPLFNEISFIEGSIELLSLADEPQPSEIVAIHLIATGGTIDGEISPTKDAIVTRQKTAITDYLKNYIKPSFHVTESQIAMKDSRELLQEDLTGLVKIILESKHENILVTHGLYNIVSTARLIERFIGKECSKKIILTGALYPIAGGVSDAAFNIGYAISAFHNVGPGVYISMQGKVFRPDEYTIQFN